MCPKYRLASGRGGSRKRNSSWSLRLISEITPSKKKLASDKGPVALGLRETPV
jgi:hypothetical protein